MAAVPADGDIATRGEQRGIRWCARARARRDAERRPREAIVESAAPAARGACLASAPGAWRARVCIAFIIMVVSWAVRVLVGL